MSHHSGDVAAIVKQTLTIEDDDIFDYIVSVISDESFEFGEDAQDAKEALGPLLVRLTLWLMDGWMHT